MAGHHPKKWKIAIITWVAIYPTITLLLIVSGELLSKIELLPVRTLVLTMVMVPFMVFFLVPVLQKRFLKWLQS